MVSLRTAPIANDAVHVVYRILRANQLQHWWSKMIEQVASGLITSCRGRSNPRCVKRRTKQHLPRQGNEPLNKCYNWKIEIVK